MNDPDPEFGFALTWMNAAIFATALAAGALVSALFHAYFTGFFIIAGVAWYLARKKS